MSSKKNSKADPTKKSIFSPFGLMVEKMGTHLGIQRMNMREVGEELGVTRSGVSDFSKKDYVPAETMIRWCAKRTVSVDWLLGSGLESNTAGNTTHKSEGENMDTDKIRTLMEQIIGLQEGITERDQKIIELLEAGISSKKASRVNVKKSGA